MTIGSRRASLLLFLGDVIVFAFSLWFTLLLRYEQLPPLWLVKAHAGPFAFLFIVWLLVFFMGGLYEKRAIFFKRDLSGRIVRTQVVNIILAALFFFFVPALGITPKTNLFIYLGVSLVFIVAWRIFIFPKLAERRTRIEALVIGAGPEVEELKKELNSNPRYAIRCLDSIDPKSTWVESFTQLLDSGEGKNIQLLIVDTHDPAVAPLIPEMYRRAFERGSYQIVDLLVLYEEVFDRVPLSRLSYEWFFRYATRRVSGFYLFMKRVIDIVGGLLMGIIAIIATPFVWLAFLFEGGGSVFITQTRIGEHETRVRAYKFRTMQRSDDGKWNGEGDNRVTRVGAFLRRTSLDEFPQFVNVLMGELSLIGPRNDIEGLGVRLAEALPYYSVRYIVKPGITGWAQVNQQYEQGNISPQSIEETKMRLAYDFYYLKHRSFMLDLVIALKTVKRMFFRLAP
jgi:lipopolysaccharide/colanic/teichoic acid biosynthesis glycosyltransferase